MPELPDVEVYVARLRDLLTGRTMERVRLASPFLLRSVEPPLAAFDGRTVTGVRRIGKRIVLEFDGLFLVIHLMIAGRLHWRGARAAIPAKVGAAAFDFAHGSLVFTEAGTKKRASLNA